MFKKLDLQVLMQKLKIGLQVGMMLKANIEWLGKVGLSFLINYLQKNFSFMSIVVLATAQRHEAEGTAY